MHLVSPDHHVGCGVPRPIDHVDDPRLNIRPQNLNELIRGLVVGEDVEVLEALQPVERDPLEQLLPVPAVSAGNARKVTLEKSCVEQRAFSFTCAAVS